MVGDWPERDMVGARTSGSAPSSRATATPSHGDLGRDFEIDDVLTWSDRRPPERRDRARRRRAGHDASPRPPGGAGGAASGARCGATPPPRARGARPLPRRDRCLAGDLIPGPGARVRADKWARSRSSATSATRRRRTSARACASCSRVADVRSDPAGRVGERAELHRRRSGASAPAFEKLRQGSLDMLAAIEAAPERLS